MKLGWLHILSEGATEALYADKKGGRGIVYWMQLDVIRESVLFFDFGNKVFRNIESELLVSSSRVVHLNMVLLN